MNLLTPLANQQMVSMLVFANPNTNERNVADPRYAYTYDSTDGVHSDEHPGSLLPVALRCLWSDTD